MRAHKEGQVTLWIVVALILIVNYAIIKLTHNLYIIYPSLAVSFFFYLFIRYFFRIPNRVAISDEMAIIAPCDGKVVVIENRFEDEFLNAERKQISIFMSPLDVHINWFPVSGKVIYSTHHKGSHGVAWAPKSSTENEHSTVVLETENKLQVLVRQIAGAMARRVVCYAKDGEYASQNDHLGFIKFGSRVDLFLPEEYEIKIDLNQKVIGSQTVIARLKKK